MSDLTERLRGAAAAGGANAPLLTEAADRIVQLNGEHDALCTDRATIVATARAVSTSLRKGTPCRSTTGHGDVCSAGWYCAACAVRVKSADELDAALPPEPPVLVQTPAQPAIGLSEGALAAYESAQAAMIADPTVANYEATKAALDALFAAASTEASP